MNTHLDTLPDGIHRPSLRYSVTNPFFVRVVTLWGLGTGTAIIVCLVAVLMSHLGVSEYAAGAGVGLVLGATGYGSTQFLKFTRQGLTTRGEADTPVGLALSLVSLTTTIFLLSVLMSFLMPLFFVAGLIWVQKDHSKGTSVAQSRDAFIKRLVPHHLMFG